MSHNLTHEAHFKRALYIVPRVAVLGRHTDASLDIFMIVGLPFAPVGVCHWFRFRSYFPDKSRVGLQINALSSYPYDKPMLVVMAVY